MTLYKQLIISLLFIINFSLCRSKDGHKIPDVAVQKISETNLHKFIPAGVTACGFLYHRFNESKYPSTNISTSLFEKQLEYLKHNDIPVITLGGLLTLKIDDPAQKKYVIITIDDAFDSFYRNGFPLLKKFGYKATLFINTETVGSGDYLDWAELKEIMDYGIEIGNHTHSHDYFLNINSGKRAESFRSNILQAQNLIKEKLSYKPVVFAYPYGEYDQNMKQIIQELGFQIAAAQNSGVISSYSDQYALPRFPMTDLYGKLESFKEKVNMNPLPVIEVLPEVTIPVHNPPTLTIQFMDLGFDLERLQCFIQGSDCEINIVDRDLISIRLTAKSPLKNRRHLYTITIPDENTGEWYWFSHQWIFPDKH